MTEPAPFDDLDRRAATAVDALDRAVDDTPIPDVEHPDASRRSRRSVPVAAVAAAVLVVALVAAAVLLTGDGDDQSTIAGEVDHTRLVFPDPESLGYATRAAFDGSAPGDNDGFLSIPATVFGPADSEDPWSGAVVSYSLPADVTTLGGEPVDIGGPAASIEESGFGATIGWSQGDRVRYLVSTRVDEGTLVDLARAAVADPDSSAIAGQQVLFTGQFSDVFPSLLTMTARGGNPVAGTRTAAVFYGDDAQEGDGGMVVATSRGSQAALRAHSVLAVDSRDVTVRGRPGVVAEFFGGDQIKILHVAWLEDPQTLVRVDALGADEAELLEQLDQLEAVDAEIFAALVAAHSDPDPDDDATSDATFRETGEPIAPTTVVTESRDDRTELSSVSIGEAEYSVGARIFAGLAGQVELDVFTEGPNGGTGSGISLDSTSTNAVLRDLVQHDTAIEGVLVAGIVGPGVSTIAVVDTVTGERVTDIDPSAGGPVTATIPESDHLLFLATVGPEYRDRDLIVVASFADGSEVTLEAQA